MKTDTRESIAHIPIKQLQERPYQREAIDAVLSTQHLKRALVVLPTGTGKTIVFSKVIHTLRIPTLVLAHRKELLKQARDKLLRYYEPDEVGTIGGGIEEWDRLVLVASVQTVRNRLPMLQRKGIKLVICDEGHHATKKNSYAKIFNALPDAYIVGFTATPERLDGANIADIFGAPVCERDIVTMVREGYLCDLRGILVHSYLSLDEMTKHLGDFDEKQLADLLNQRGRNSLIIQAYLTYARGLSAICFAVNVEHAYAIASTFNDYGIPSIALDGKTPSDQRERILEQFEQGHIKVLVNCEILTEGFDAPYVGCIIMARPTLSRSLFLQMLGRGTRLNEGKKECIILDITDNCTKHRLLPQNFKTIMGVHSGKQNISILEHDDDEQKRKAAQARKDEERRLEQERLRAEAIRRMQEISEGKRREEEEERQRAIAERKNVTFTEISLFGRDTHWQHTDEESISIKVAYATITINPSEYHAYRYSVSIETKYGTRCIEDNLTLATAKGIAAREAHNVEANVRSRYADTPTEKQLETLRKFRIAIPIGCTRGQASTLIASRIAQLEASRKGA